MNRWRRVLKYLPGGIGGYISFAVDGWRGWFLFWVGVFALLISVIAYEYEQ